MLTAVIPVRAGSTRVKNKNIRPFAGSSLLQVKIRQLQQVRQIDRIVVSSDSEEMLRIAGQEGVVAARRPVAYCDEKTKTFNEVVAYVANEEVTGEHMLWAPCVCPFVDAGKFAQAIETYYALCENEGRYDSLVSAALIQAYLFDEKGPANFLAKQHVPSQYLPRWHVITNGFYIARRENMARWSYLYGANPFLFEIDKLEAIDIDDEIDFAMAEWAYERYRGAI